MSGQAPSYMYDLLTPVSAKLHNTRFSSENNLCIKSTNTEAYKTSFSYSGPILWNSLSTEIKNSRSISEFKSLYKTAHFK